MKIKQILSKTSAEIKFRPKLASWENTVFLAQLFEDEFPDWQIDKGVRSQILLFSKENREVLKVAFNSLAYICEKDDDISKFRKFLKRGSEKFDESDVEIFQHIEYKNILFFETELNLDELSEFLFEKLYGSQEKVRAISADSIRDVAFTLDAEKNGFLNNCRIGPMQKQQLIETYKSVFDFSGEDISDEKTYLYLDINIYLSDPQIETLTDSIKVFDSLSEENKRITNEYLKMIKNIE